jgi:hypothetical protein
LRAFFERSPDLRCRHFRLEHHVAAGDIGLDFRETRGGAYRLEIVRTVSSTKAYVSFKGRLWKVPASLPGRTPRHPPALHRGRYGVFFASYQVAIIDLTNTQTVSHVPEQLLAMSPD